MICFCRKNYFQRWEKIDPTFPDVTPNYWAYGYIEKLYLLGIVSGYPDGKFWPEQIVTRDQMCVFIGRAFQNISLSNGGYVSKVEHFSIKDDKTITFDVILPQSNQIGLIIGNLKDSRDAPVNNARVEITLEPVYPETYEALTDNNGNFSIHNVPAGFYAYSIIKSDDSYAQFDLSENWENEVVVNGGETTTLNLTIQ